MASILARAKELRDSGVSAIEAARQARQELTTPTSPNTTTPSVNSGFKKTTNADGTVSISGSVAPPFEKPEVILGGAYETNPSPALPSIPNPSMDGATVAYTGGTSSTEGSPVSSTNNQGNSSTVTGGGYGTGGGTKITGKNKTSVIEGKTNQVLGEVVDNYDTNKTTDRVQMEQQKLTAEAAAIETDTELKRYEAEKKSLAEEEDRIQKKKAAEDANNLIALQNQEREANNLAIEAARAKSEAAERELSIANDVELQKSNVAFAKLGLILSTAAATSAQQIFTTGVYNLSKLKSENAFEMANLKVEVAKVEFDHTAKVNDIINKSSEKSYTIRKTLNDDMNKIKNSIIDNRVARQENIDKAVDNYQKAILENEANTLELIKKSSTALDDTVKSMYDTLKVKESYNQDKINSVVTSGKWFTMSPSARLAYEQGAGLPKGTVVSQVRGEISKGVVKELEGIPLSSGKLNGIINEALQLMDTGGMPMSQAIQSALLNNSEYQTQLKLAQAKKNKVGGSGGTKATTAYGTSNLVSYVNDKGVTSQANYVPGKGGTPGYIESDGVRIPMTGISKISPVNPNNLNDDGEKPIGE